MATRIYTKTGDRGETGLFGGSRARKDDVRVEAYGAVDELNAAVGLSRAAAPSAPLDDLLRRVQCLLFELGGELATAPGRKPPPASVTEADAAWLERAIDEAGAALPRLRAFILPGGTQLAAALHQARTICRRAERRVVTLRSAQPETSATAVIVLNRLSDLLFVLARQANHLAGVEDVKWTARGEAPPS